MLQKQQVQKSKAGEKGILVSMVRIPQSRL